MLVRFDLPEALEEFEDMEEALDKPCFPYPGLDGRPGGIDMWLPLPAHHSIRLNLKVVDRISGYPDKKPAKRMERKMLLRINTNSIF